VCFETPGLRGFFKDLGECPRLVFGFPVSSGQLVLYSVFGFVFIFCIKMGPCICMRLSTQYCTCTCLWRMFVLG